MDKINELDYLKNKGENNIKLIYKVEKRGKYKLFGDKFVENNQNNIKLYVNGFRIYLNKEYDLEKGDNIIIMNIINPIKNLENMFYNCNHISNIDELINLDTQYCNNFSNMFYGYSSLNNIQSLEKWNVSNGKDFSYMFYGCFSLSDISSLGKWNVSNCKDFSYMFYRCKSLLDISSLENWNVSKGIYFSFMFSQCSLLKDINS